MEACNGIREDLLKRAGKIKNAPLEGAEPADVTFVDGEMRVRGDPSRARALTDVLQGLNDPIKSEVTSKPAPKVFQRYSHYTHSAVFAEVRLDEELGMLRVVRGLSAVSVARSFTPRSDAR